jgi:hypothetical protein
MNFKMGPRQVLKLNSHMCQWRAFKASNLRPGSRIHVVLEQSLGLDHAIKLLLDHVIL